MPEFQLPLCSICWGTFSRSERGLFVDPVTPLGFDSWLQSWFPEVPGHGSLPTLSARNIWISSRWVSAVHCQFSSLPDDIWKVMFLTVSGGSLRCFVRKFVTVFSESSSACSGIPENTRLSLMLHVWMSNTVFVKYFLYLESWLIPSVRDFIYSNSSLFSTAWKTTSCWLNCSDSHIVWNSLWSDSMRFNLASKLKSLDFRFGKQWSRQQVGRIVTA